MLIENYIYAYPHEKAPYDMLSFYKTERAIFSKRNKKGHFTGSGWIVSPDKRKILMTHHKIINKWLQLGGHADGEGDLLKVALRESIEESGFREIKVLNETIFDLDIHKIQKTGPETSHFHYDVRFLLEADPNKESIVVSDESYDVAWIPIEGVLELNPETSIHRMIEKTKALLK
ncbi:uncharacterized protein METZ01_LOCUS67698 [marine metagenome]|uniref:Nudix hydrolase domain-containing protein n=1 Tax=marine metagenome TaxID=408172 RepID=A0A381TGF6_9ZZZZ